LRNRHYVNVEIAGKRPAPLPSFKIRVVNGVNLMKLQPNTEHPHGLSDPVFDEIP
jgi:phosphoketolase